MMNELKCCHYDQTGVKTSCKITEKRAKLKRTGQEIIDKYRIKEIILKEFFIK